MADNPAPSLLSKWLLMKEAVADPRVTKSDIKVLYRLLDHDGVRGCFPGMGRMAKDTALTTRSILTAVQHLRELDYVSYEQRKKRHRRELDTNLYYPNYARSKDKGSRRSSPDDEVNALASFIREYFPDESGSDREYDERIELAEDVREKIVQDGENTWTLLSTARDLRKDNGKEDGPADSQLDRLITQTLADSVF